MERESPSSRKSSQGERKQVTVLFADVAGFTSLSEELDPEEVRDLIGPALDIMAEEIHAYEGTVAQFMGDGLMALFGAPLAHEDDPQRAVYAALAMQERLKDYREKLKAQGFELSTRIGINTGLVIVGSVGEELGIDYTALGDTVNLASRMESTAEPGTVQISENTYRLTQGYFDFSDQGEIEVKGRGKPVHTWRVLGGLPAHTRISASLAHGLSPFVGREKELDQVCDCYVQVKAGSGQVVGVMGEPGAGKSRLLLEFRESLPQEECTYLEGGCIHYGEAIAYLPILRILRDYFYIGEGEGEASIKQKLEEKLSSLNGQLDHVLPPLQELLSLEVDDQAYLSLEPAQRRDRVFEAVRYLLIAESRQRPLVLAIEDLHWMDRTSEEFLSSFIEGMPASNILLILLYRPEYTPVWTSKTFYSQVRVDQLPDEPSTKLVEAILSSGEVSSEISDFIVGRTAGNPLFIEELTRGLLEAGSIVKENEYYTLATSPSDIQVPETIHGIIASRLDRLPEELKETLQVASVIGREFSLCLLQEITASNRPLKSCLLELQSLEFIYEKALFPEPQYIFKHALTQEVAYESLLLKRRREMHERIAQAIEKIYPDTLEDHYETLAYHYSRSTAADKAIHYLELSGEGATSSYANWEAVRFYEEAIGVLDTLPADERTKSRKLEEYFAMLGPLMVMSYPQGSLEIIQETERLAEELKDKMSLLAVYTKYAGYYGIKGNISMGLGYSKRIIDAADEVKNAEAMSKAAFELCTPLFHAGDFQELSMVGRKAITLIQEQCREKDIVVGGFTIYAAICGWYILALGCMGEYEEAAAVLDEGLKISQEMDDTLGVAWLETAHAGISFFSGDISTIEYACRAVELSEKTGAEMFLSTALSLLGLGHFFLGDHEKSRHYTEKSLKRQRETGLPAMLSWSSYSLSLSLLALGDLERARYYADDAVRLSREFKSKLYEAGSCTALGRIVGEADPAKLEFAEGYIRRGISMFDEIKAKPTSAMGYLFLGEVFELADRREEALENLKKAEEMYRDMGVPPDSYWLTRTREGIARLESVS